MEAFIPELPPVLQHQLQKVYARTRIQLSHAQDLALVLFLHPGIWVHPIELGDRLTCQVHGPSAVGEFGLPLQDFYSLHPINEPIDFPSPHIGNDLVASGVIGIDFIETVHIVVEDTIVFGIDVKIFGFFDMPEMGNHFRVFCLGVLWPRCEVKGVESVECPHNQKYNLIG